MFRQHQTVWGDSCRILPRGHSVLPVQHPQGTGSGCQHHVTICRGLGVHQAPSLGFTLQDWEVQSCLAASLLHEFFTPKFVTQCSFGSKRPKRNDLPHAASLRTRGQGCYGVPELLCWGLRPREKLSRAAGSLLLTGKLRGARPSPPLQGGTSACWWCAARAQLPKAAPTRLHSKN